MSSDVSFIRTLILLDQGSILMTLFNLNYLPKGPMSKYSHAGGVGILTYEFWGITDIQIITPFKKLFFFFFGCTAWHAGSQFPNHRLNPQPLQWKLRILTTRLPGKS